MVKETEELAHLIGESPVGFAKQVAQAIHLLLTDSEVRQHVYKEFVKEWRENPSKALIKLGIGILCGAATGAVSAQLAQKVIGPVKTLIKFRAAAVLNKLKGKLSAPFENRLKDLATEAANATNPDQLRKLAAEIEAIEGMAAKGIVGCFVAGTPILTPDGPRPIEALAPGDLVYSACEDDPDCTVGVQVVQQAMRSLAPAWTVRIGGRSLRMTPGHPLFARGRGWQPLHELAVGVEVRGKDGDYHAIVAIEPSHVPEVVHNVEVGEYHTFFVGNATWGFAIWVHNEMLCSLLSKARAGDEAAKKALRERLAKPEPGDADTLVKDLALKKELDDWKAADCAPNNASYTFKGGKRAGQTVDFGVPERKFKFVKQSEETLAKLRSDFEKMKPDWIKHIATNKDSVAALKKAGLSDAEIAKMASTGRPPAGYQVHHIDPLDGGGKNVTSNFILAKQDPQHLALTATHNTQTAALNVGESADIVLPKLDGIIFPQ